MLYWKRSWAYSKRDQCKWHLFSRSLCPSTLAKPTSVQKNTQFWVGVAISEKSFSLDDKIIASNAKAEVFFETFLFSKETWKLPLYPVARKNTQAQLFFHSAHISQRPHILRILLKMLTCYFKNVGCAYFFADHTNGLWWNVSKVHCNFFFQFDRNYAWSQHDFAKYIFSGTFYMTCPFAFACQNMFYSEIVQFD